MFIAGLEIDMRVFRATRQRSLGFGGLTFLLPLLAGMAVALSFEFDWVAALLVGSLLASHTLLGFPIVTKLGLGGTEPVAVTVGATIFTDIASLLILAICISIHQRGSRPLASCCSSGGWRSMPSSFCRACRCSGAFTSGATARTRTPYLYSLFLSS